MGGYGAPSRVMPSRLSSISMHMVWTVTPPCRSFIRCRCSNRTPGGEHAKKNQQRNDFHFLALSPSSTSRRQLFLLVMNLEQARIRIDVLCPQLLHHRLHLKGAI